MSCIQWLSNYVSKPFHQTEDEELSSRRPVWSYRLDLSVNQVTLRSSTACLVTTSWCRAFATDLSSWFTKVITLVKVTREVVHGISFLLHILFSSFIEEQRLQGLHNSSMSCCWPNNNLASVLLNQNVVWNDSSGAVENFELMHSPSNELISDYQMNQSHSSQ